MSKKKDDIKDAFSNMASTPEFQNLMGSVFGKLQNGISNIETGINDSDFPLKDILNKFKGYNISDELDIDDLDLSQKDNENIESDSESSLDDNDLHNSEIIDCEVSSDIDENIESINLKITELNNSIINVFTDKKGNNIADILSELSSDLKQVLKKLK